MFDGRILSRHAEGIEAHRMQDIEALHGLIAGHDIADGIVADMPHVKIARRVREHLQRVILRTVRVSLGLVDVFAFPFILPLLFNLLR